jgi:hypothetical protein
MTWVDRLIERVRALLRGEKRPMRRVLTYHVTVSRSGRLRFDRVLVNELDADARRRLIAGLELDAAWASVASATTGKKPELTRRCA